jgi:hypothetical protein
MFDAAPRSADEAAWRRLDRLAVLGAIALSLGAYLLLVVTDPYDTGRFFRWPIGISDSSPHTADASRGRDPRFNAAVIGNSRGQILDPARLSDLTGRRFVQLTVPGTRAREQLAMLHWFARHHADIGAVVLVMDEWWCTSDPALPIGSPFPFWLYADDDMVYLKSIMRAQAFERLWRRVRVALHMIPPNDPAGYWNYDLIPGALPDARKLESATPMAMGRVPDAPFPALERLRDEIARLDPAVPIVMIAPPTFHSLLPPEGSAEAARLAVCKRALGVLAASRPRGAFIDLLVDSPLTRDPANFRDVIHYRGSVARGIEDAVAKAIGGG